MSKIALIGATGLVGRTTLKVMEEHKLTNHKFEFFASTKSVGKTIKFNKKNFIIKELDLNYILEQNFNFALFCTNEKVSSVYVPLLARNGIKAIDFSSYFRHTHPLIVPEINADKIDGNIICNPNCSTIASVMALYEINNKFGLKEIVFSTYQAVSGAGKLGLSDLKISDKNKLQKFSYVIKNNLIPYIGNIDENGYSTEENKMIYETRKILNNFDIKISATCVRVPIDICHSISIHFTTRKKCDVNDIKNVLEKTKGVKIFDKFDLFPMPILVKGKEDVFVGRIKKCQNKNTFDMFVVSDNLRKGAGQNGVQILEELLKDKNESL